MKTSPRRAGRRSPPGSSIEPLEVRIAPASVFHYTDVDGDKVTITASVGDLGAGGIVNVAAGHLHVLDLSSASFNHGNLSFSVIKAPTGDGLANVGEIKGGTNDFGNIMIKGDLGQMDAGSSSPTVPALKSLSVRSLGQLGLDTQGGGGDLQSDLHGALGALTVQGDVVNAYLNVVGA